MTQRSAGGSIVNRSRASVQHANAEAARWFGPVKVIPALNAAIALGPWTCHPRGDTNGLLRLSLSAAGH